VPKAGPWETAKIIFQESRLSSTICSGQLNGAMIRLMMHQRISLHALIFRPLLAASPLLLLASLIGGQTPHAAAPKFQDYPVASVYRGPTKAPIFGGQSQYSGTDLRCFGGDPSEYRQMRVNFAGHFVIDTCTCGSGCHYFFVWDAMTGKVYLDRPLGSINVGPYGTAPHMITYAGEQYRPDSTLLVVNGCRGETCDCGTWYFGWKDGKLDLIHKQATKRPPGCAK
jgi:hypothetical protein